MTESSPDGNSPSVDNSSPPLLSAFTAFSHYLHLVRSEVLWTGSPDSAKTRPLSELSCRPRQAPRLHGGVERAGNKYTTRALVSTAQNVHIPKEVKSRISQRVRERIKGTPRCSHPSITSITSRRGKLSLSFSNPPRRMQTPPHHPAPCVTVTFRNEELPMGFRPGCEGDGG